MALLVTVGTGTVVPHPRRSSPAHWFAHGPVRLLMDCGPGTIHRLAQLGLPWNRLTHVALTHFHNDHVGEFPALLYAMKWGQEQHRDEPLVVYGPAGTLRLLRGLASGLGEWVVEPGFPLEVREIGPADSVRLADDLVLTTHRTPHTEESLALSLALTGSRLVYTSDTGPSDELADWARGCDLLLAECSLPDSRAIDMHLTPRQAGAMAARAKAKRLVLTHLYPPVEEVDIVSQAREQFTGQVVVAQDGSMFTV